MTVFLFLSGKHQGTRHQSFFEGDFLSLDEDSLELVSLAELFESLESFGLESLLPSLVDSLEESLDESLESLESLEEPSGFLDSPELVLAA